MATIVHNNNNLISLCTTKLKYIHNIIMLTCRVLSILRTMQHPMQYNSKSKKTRQNLTMQTIQNSIRKMVLSIVFLTEHKKTMTA